MRKLNLDTLVVESFCVNENDAPAGTVFGYEEVTRYNCNLTDDDYTCWAGCQHTVAPANTCANTCGMKESCGSMCYCFGGGTVYGDPSCGQQCISDTCEPE